MKRVLIALAVFCLVVVGALAAVPLFVSTQWVRETVVSQLSRATGLAITIDGPVGLRAFPTIGLSAGSVRVRAPDGADVMSLTTLRTDLALIPLLSGSVRINEILLSGLHVALIRKEDGSITLPGLPTPTGSTETVDTGGSDSDGLADLVAILERLSVDRFDIRDGVVVVEDAGSGLRETIDKVAFRLRLPGLDENASAEGSLSYRGKPVSFSAKIGTPRTLTSTAPTLLDISVDEGPVTGAITGTVILADLMSFDGKIALASKDLAGAIEWATGSPADVPLGSVAIDARAVMTPIAIALTDLAAQIGDTTITGALSLPTATEVPKIQGRLAADRIDLAEFLPKGSSETAPKSGDTPIDLGPLRSVDADLTLTLGALETDDLTLENLSARVLLDKGVLQVEVPKVGIGGGAIALTARARDDAGTASVDGHVTIGELPLATLLAFAPVPYDASGTLVADVAFKAGGTTTETLIAGATAEGTLGLRNGTISGLPLAEAVPDDRTAGTLDAIGLDARFAGTDGPVTLSGGFTWRGERFAIEGRTGAPGVLLSGAPTDLSVRLSSSRVSTSYAGTVTTTGAASGRVGLATPSLRGLLAWLNRPIGAGGGLEATSVEGVLAATASSVSLSEAALSLDESTARGNVSVALSGKRPVVKADLAFDRLDLTPYLSGGSGDAPAAASGDAGWSREPLDLSGLRAADASLSLTAQTITVDAFKTGAATLGVTLDDGTLDALLSRFELYSGSGTGRVTLTDSRGATTKATFSLDGVDVHQLLKDAAGFGALAGAGQIALDLTGAGKSTYALVRSLDGSASFAIHNGAILGINIPRMVRSLSTSILNGWQSDPAEKTDFTAFGSSFQISDGVASTSDLSLIGPLVRLSGEGSADLADKTLNFRVDPRVVASLQGQGSESDMKGLGVPIMITGSWSGPKIYPDIKGILQNPQAALEQLKSISGQFGDLASLDQLGGTGAIVGKLASGDTKGAIGSLIDQQLGQLGGGQATSGGDLKSALASMVQQQVSGTGATAGTGGGSSGAAKDLIGSAIGQLAGGLAGAAPKAEPVPTTPVPAAEAPAPTATLPAPTPPVTPDTTQVVTQAIGGLVGQPQSPGGQQAQQVVGGLVGGLLGQAAQQNPDAGSAVAVLGGLLGGGRQPQPAPQAVPQAAAPQPVAITATTTVTPRPNPRR